MSRVTSVILTMSSGEESFDVDEGPTPLLDKVNALLDGYGKSPLVFLTPHMWRGKSAPTLTFGGSYNYFPTHDFVELLSQLPWVDPASVVAVIQPEDGDLQIWQPAG